MNRSVQLLFAFVVPVLTACEGIPLHLGAVPPATQKAAPSAAAPGNSLAPAGLAPSADTAPPGVAPAPATRLVR